jgi:hypothetical protein
MKQKLLKTNEEVNWYPNHFKKGRFAKSIESAPDWNISRSRYWGSPVPVWECECGERYVPESIKELEQWSGVKINDLHKPGIDEVVIKCKKCDQNANRVQEVLDSWIEAGSASFAERHYPFNSEEKIEDFFPPDFIAEYTGQIRAWFYVLHVIGTALFDSPAFKNVVVEGVILGTDGRKMSKNYGNFPDPKKLIEQYGGDALRMYLLGSPVMNGEDIRISEIDYRDQVRGTLLILWNVYNFFVTYAIADNWSPSEKSVSVSQNVLDRWILSKVNKLNLEVSDKLIDRINKSNINNSNYKSFENDVISINVYKKNVENDDIVYYPQKFYFDLSLYPKEINNLNINPKMSFERLLNKFSLYDFSILGKNFENIIDLSNINQSDKYSFLTKEEKKSMFENHIVSNLLQTYIYLLTGISFSEEVFPTIPYDEFNLATTTTNQNTELLLRAYFKAIMNFDYPSQNNMLSALTDPAIPDSVKDDMQLLLYGTNMLRPNLILSKVLETKKFDRILIIPVNIDNFGINVNQTSQTTGGKRFVSKNSYQKKLTKIKIGNNELIQENRDKNSLIFEDYFVSIDTITKEE